MTRKVALFIHEGQLLTIHRKPQPYLDQLKSEAASFLQGQALPALAATAALLLAVVDTYGRPLEQAESAVDRFEETVSIFFLPLTFIVGVYGMNFEFMPEIHAWGRWGYPFAWALMVAVTLGIWIWARRRGWLK